jgi:hypothetical protein
MARHTVNTQCHLTCHCSRRAIAEARFAREHEARPQPSYGVGPSNTRPVMRPAILVTAALLACESHPRAIQEDTRATAMPATLPGVDSTAVSVVGPTLIAFYPDVSQAQADSSEALSTVLDDYSFHLSTASDSLRKLGFVIVERAHGPIHILSGSSSREVVPAPDSADVGYIFTAPGRQDSIAYGVMTNGDLIDAGTAFLGLRSRPPA